jgi:uncharacterized DUF497 family protein
VERDEVLRRAARFEWDEAKRRSNLAKHGLDFRLAEYLFDGRPTVLARSPHLAEERFLTTGIVDDLYLTVVWTRRGNGVRVISLRRAGYAERREHHALHGGGA